MMGADVAMRARFIARVAAVQCCFVALCGANCNEPRGKLLNLLGSILCRRVLVCCGRVAQRGTDAGRSACFAS